MTYHIRAERLLCLMHPRLRRSDSFGRLRIPLAICCLWIGGLAGCASMPFSFPGHRECPHCQKHSTSLGEHSLGAGPACCAAPGVAGGASLPEQSPTAFPATVQNTLSIPGLQGPAIPVPLVPGEPLNSAPGASLQAVPELPQATDGALRQTEEELQSCRKATEELQLQIQELKLQLESHQRTNTAMSSAMQFLNREMQRVSSDVEYWKTESQRQDEVSLRQIEAERATLAEIQRLLQSAAGSSPPATRSLPPVDATSSF